MKKRISSILTLLFIAFSISFIAINNVDAADTITIKSSTKCSNTVSHHRVTTTGLDAYCMELGVVGPKAGDKLTYSKTYDKGIFVYIVNNTSIAGAGSDTKAILTRQHAIWLCQGHTPDSNYKYKVKESYAYYSEAQQLCEAAKNAGDNFEIKPAILSVTNPGTLKIGNDNYYSSGKITVKLKDITGNKYKISFSGAPSGTAAYTTNGTKITDYTTESSFIIKVPASSVTTKTTFDVNITANKSEYKQVKRYYHKTLQDVAVPYAVSQTPTAKVQASIDPAGVTIKKVDSDTNKVLSGAKYKIYSNSNCTNSVANFTGTYTTNTSGTVTIVGLIPGTYYIKEVAAPTGYSISSSSCQSVTTGGTVTFKNKKNFIKLYKQDENHQNLPGATFGLYTNSTCTSRAVNVFTGQMIDFENTNSNGTVTFEGMASTDSYYYLKEETPPLGYYELSESENCKPVRVNGSATFTNVRVAFSELSIQKRDSYTKFGINGVRIGLYSDAQCSNKITEAITSSGQVKFKVEYVEGTVASLYAKELVTPSGYVPENGKGNIPCKELKLGTPQNSVIIYNKPYGNIRLLKKDAETDKPLSGVEFILLDENQKEVYDADKNKVGSQKTNENGNIEFKNIVYGTYYIKEVSTDGKHKMLKKPLKFILNNKTDAITLSSNSSTTYKLGDANGDSKIDEQDLMVYQSIVNNPDLIHGLSPDELYALDINGDGNLNSNDIKTDMKILEYYINIANSSDSSIINAAKNYSEYKDSFCSKTGDSDCDVSNLDVVLNMYNHNKSIIQSYNTAQQTANEQAASSNAEARRIYEEQLETYRSQCPDGVNTATDDSKCLYPPTFEEIESENICLNYSSSIYGDINHDCSVDQRDINAFEGSNLDLNSDGKSNNTDLKILTNYVKYINSSNVEEIVSAMNTFVNNQGIICDALHSETCSISDTQLKNALSNVGKSGSLPSNVARASITVVNQPIYMKISKQSISNSKEIPGAKIVIRDEKGNKILEFTSGKKPKTFKIGTGKYTLTEKVAPKGYKTLTTVISFEVLDDGNTKLLGAVSSLYKIKKSNGYNNHLIILNEPYDKVVVPDTGSNVAAISIISGIILVVGGGYLLYKRIA